MFNGKCVKLQKIFLNFKGNKKVLMAIIGFSIKKKDISIFVFSG